MQSDLIKYCEPFGSFHSTYEMEVQKREYKTSVIRQAAVGNNGTDNPLITCLVLDSYKGWDIGTSICKGS
jgi:hypothetical protein